MSEVTYINADGTPTTVDIEAGQSVMQGALTNGITGIVGECGGNAMCATCHVYVDASSTAELPPRSLVEDEMLEFAACPRSDTSRLGCQIVMNDDITGLVVQLPEEQL